MTIRRKIIHIQSIREIDTKSIYLQDINNLYVDKNQQYYATKYNLKTHTIDIILIIRGLTNVKEVTRQKRNQHKAKEIPTFENKKDISIEKDIVPIPIKEEVDINLFLPKWVRERDYVLEINIEYNYDSYIFDWKKEYTSFINQFNILASLLRKINPKNQSNKQNNKELNNIEDLIVIKINKYLKDLGHNLNILESSKQEQILKRYGLSNELTFEQKEYILSRRRQNSNTNLLGMAIFSISIFKAFQYIDSLSSKISVFLTAFPISKDVDDIEIFFQSLKNKCETTTKKTAEILNKIFLEGPLKKDNQSNKS